ncbi:MAG: inorganic phosphate transporter [Myxococcales bacterium]|nr:inorganic phosphate transporter [Myxococcales bacterium]
MDPSILLIVAGCFGFYMAFQIGANDVANAMGTSVGSKAITLKQAIVLAGIFELAGAILVGGHVTKTVGAGLIDMKQFLPRQYLYGMMSALLSAAVWLNIATHFGLPVSTTHSIVGAVWGFGLVAAGPKAIVWGKVGQVIASWFVSPVFGALFAFLIFRVIHKRVFQSDEPIEATRRIAPWLVALIGFILTLTMVFKGLKHLKLDLSIGSAVAIGLGISVLSFFGAVFFFNRHTLESDGTSRGKFKAVEGMFRYLQIITACFMAFAHGANDVANAIGPLASIDAIVKAGAITGKMDVALWILVLGAFGIVIGLSIMGYKVISTVGEKITDMTPTRGFAAEFGAATTVVVCSKMGLPISTTHTLVGAVIGVGLARGMSALNMSVIKKVWVSWLATLPIAAALTTGFYYTMIWLF